MHNLKIVLVQIRDLNISGNCAKFKNIFSHLIRLLIYFFPELIFLFINLTMIYSFLKLYCHVMPSLYYQFHGKYKTTSCQGILFK